MKKVRYFLSSFLLLVLCLDIIRLPITIFSESVSATTPLTIRTKYIEHLKEDGQKLAIKLDTSQKQLDRLDVIVQIEEGVDISKGLSLVFQNELELESQLDEQGFPKEKLPPGFVKDEDYREEDVPKEFPEQEVAPTVATQDSLEASLPVYGLGYYSIKIKPEPERHIEWKVDEENPERRYEEILLRLKIKKPLQTGQFMAVLSSDYKTILTEDWKTFEELVKRNSIEMVTDSVASDTEQPIPETSESTSDNTQSNPVPEGEEVIQEEQALAIQTANLRLVLREHEEGVLQPSKPIAGAEFIITSVENPEISYNGRTDEQGILDWKDLPLGEYQISQLSTAQGYEVEKQLTVIQLQESGAEKIIHVTNAKKNGLEGRIGSMLRSARTRRAITETNTDRTTTIINNPNGTTTTVTKEEEITKDIFDPIRIEIPGVTRHFRQGGDLRKKEIQVTSTGEKKIIWEYITTVTGANDRYIKQIANTFMVPVDSGLGIPKIVSIVHHDGQSIANPETAQFRHDGKLNSVTNHLPIRDGTYVYTIETPILLPSENYTLDYYSDVKVQAPTRTRLTQNGQTIELTREEERNIKSAGSLTLPSDQTTSPYDTPKLSDTIRVNGRYRESNNKVIEWYTSRLNTTDSVQTYTFDVAEDKNTQAVHSKIVYVYEPTEGGNYRLKSTQTVDKTQNQITVNDVPVGGIAVVETITNVTNEKANHTITGASLEALKGDITIHKKWATGTEKTAVTFSVNGGSYRDHKVTLQANQSQVTVPNVEKFSGTGSTATKTRIYYEVTEDVPDGYALSTAQMDWKNLQYVFTNKKDTSQPITPKPPGSCESYGVTHVEPVNINWLIWERNGNKWGGFHGSLKFYFKLPAFAKEGDSFTIELPRELKLEHLANPSVEWTPVYKSGTNEILARTYHVEDRKLKFVLTSAAYSVTEYSGWFEIGSDQSSGLVQINNDRNVAGRKYLTGVRPEVPVWYSFDLENPINTQSNIVNKKLKYKTSYKGGNFDCSYTVIGDGTLNATENGSGGLQGSLRQFSSVHKQAINQTADSVTWELVYNGERNDITGGVGHDSRKIWDRIHENSSLYDGDVHTSIPRNIKVFVADGNPAASYTESEMVRLSLVATSRSGEQTTYHYGIKGVTNMGLAILLKRESWYDAQFNYRSNYTLEFYHEGAGWGRKTIVARIKQRKNGNTTLRNAVSLNWNSVVLGGDKSPNNFFVAGDTVASGGAYPTGWYGFQLKKVDQQKRPLEGAVFTLYDSQQRPYQTIRSNEQGILEFTNILGGEYTFKEVEAPAGYTLDTTVHRLNIRNSENITINGKLYTAQAPFEIINKKDAKLSLKLKKKDLANTPLKGAVFRLRKTDGGQPYDETLGDTFESDEFLFNELTAGNYTLEEVRAPTGYRGMGQINLTVYEENGTLKLRKQADAANSQTSTPQLNNGVVTLDIYNQPLELTFTKQNTQGQPLENAIFELRQIHSTGFTVVRTNLFSKANGQFVLKGLLPNTTYELWETRAPDGYAKPTQAVVQFTVNEDGAAHFTRGSSTIVNSPPKFKVKIVKIDAETGQPITEGVNDTAPRFTVTNATGDTLNGQIANLQNGMYTFTNGSGANSGFEAGTYYLKEIRAPQGYTRLTNLIPFTIHSDGRVTVSEEFADGVATSATSPDTVQIKVKNDRLKTLRISKRIKGLEDLPSLITGQMTFTLSKDNDVSFQPVTVTQAANTDFVFNNLTYGSYTLVETAPPAGYMVEPIVYKVAVSRAGVSLYRTSDQVTPSRVEGVSLITSPDLSNIQSGPESNAIDGSETTSVTYHNFNGQGNTIPVGAYLGVDLQSVKRVRNIFYLQGNQNNVTDRMNRYTVEYSIDGETYYPIASSATTERFEQSTDLLARYIRVRNEEQVVNKWYAVRELRISAQEAESVSLQGGQAFPIGNIQHPFIRMEKRDSETGAIIQGTATFKLYKVPEDTTETTLSTAINDNNLIQTFQLANGQTGNETLLIKELGKYALVETQAPDGYIGLSQPVLLEATEARQAHSDTKNKHVTRFAVLSSSDKVTVDTSSTANDNVLKLQVKNRQKVYNLKILKRDAQNAQQGLTATFGLFNADGTNKIAEGQTNENDHSYTFSQLRPGTYTLKELQTPINYNPLRDFKIVIANNGQVSVLDTPTRMVEVGNTVDTTISLTIKNRTYTPISIQKVDKRSNETTLIGVRLRIQAKNGNQMPQFSNRSWHETNYQGRVIDTEKALEWVSSTAGNAVFQLPQGTYTISELSAPAGYEQLQPFDITVAEDGSVQLAQGTNPEQVSQGTKDGRINIKLTNVFKPKIKIIKVDSRDANRKLAGARFKLFGPDENTQIGQEVTTSSNGEITLPGLEPGTYYLQESQPPTDYQANARKYQIIIDANGSAQITNADAKIENGASQDQGADKIIPITVKNERETYNLKILQRDAQNAQQGLIATFGLYNADGISKITEGQTNPSDHSYTFSQLLPGTYVLKEERPPSGYIQVDPVRLEITQAGQLRILSGDSSLLEIGASSGNTLQLTVKNDSKKTLRISKRIKGLEDLPSLITGQMTFTLTKDNDATAVSAVQTHAATEDFVFNNLTYGSYTLVETAPPAGYMVEPITYKVSVSRSGVSLYKVANAAPSERVAGATLFKSPDLSNIQSGQDGDAIDGSDTTSVTYQNFNGQGDNIPAGAYLGVDLQGVKRVRHIHYLQGTQHNALDRFNRFTLEYSIDGRTYFPLSTYTEHGLVDLNTDIVARYIRVRNEDRVVQKWYGVRELTVSAQATETVNALSAGQYPIGNIQHPEIQIEKQDMNNRIIQQAVTFKLYKVPDDATSQTVTGALTNQNLVQTFTLTNGQVRQTLEAKVLGRYALVEGTPPTGYRALASPVLLDLQTLQQPHSGSQMKTVTRFNLVGTNDKVRIDTNTANVLKFIVKNEPLTYHLKILKRDVNNAATGLDARFELYNENETRPPLSQGNTTLPGNSLTFRNLQPGTYVLKEVTAPTGYNPIQKIKLTISLDGQIRIVEGPQDLLASQAVNANNEIELVVKNRPFTDFSIEKVSNLTPTINLAGVQLQIKAKNNGPAPLFSDDDWHRQQYRATIDTANKALTWWTQSNDVGNAVFKLPQGTYTISELAAPAGYELLQPFDIIVGEDGQVRLANGAPTNAEINTKDNRLNLKLTNIFKPKLKIIKVDSRDENRRLANATFKLFGGDGRTQVGSDLVTGATGEIETPALTPGTYYLQESQPPTGYQANARKYQIIIDANGLARIGNADNKIEVGTSQDQGADKIIPITVKNDRTPFTVKIRKRDYDETSRGLDARFQLYRKDGEQEVLLQGLVGNTSGANSELLLPNLLPNTYVLKEITAPAGNYEAIRPIQFTITEEGRLQIDVNDRGFASVENGGNSQELVLLIKNIKKFRLRIKKQDATNEQTLLDGANFTLYRARDHNGGKLEAIASKVTANGLADIDVGPGYFILQETQAPTGYVLNGKEYIFQINHDGTVLLRNGDDKTSLQGADSNRVVVFTMKNTRTTSQFKLAKRSYRNPAQRLEATFELKESGNAQATAVVKRTTTTGDEVLFDNLPVGKSYILKETVAPDGYQKIEKEIHIDIGADGAITIQDGGDLVSLDNTDSHLIIVKNLRKGEYPKTGGIGIIPYIALGGVMMLLALAVELGKEKRWKHIRK
ncbi:SpaA isopeptide-forming pilin-related protein [Streptococcus suis]|uniref:SpaA isopeptide-forming pilin-related protein n=1 Tax=Streptococcus suis TaxID=1307 RepID=UPI002892A838|nr:SpaA isopeptide-forming pilin-related protein [Streptococcus suis]WNF70294.1 SpaA isopeptide-forming pilin-related protein [Streptococcus suis]